MLKEYMIGTEVYKRKPSSYHPTEDGIVRSEAHRLRSKLKQYYESIGKEDPVFICYRARVAMHLSFESDTARMGTVL